MNTSILSCLSCPPAYSHGQFKGHRGLLFAGTLLCALLITPSPSSAQPVDCSVSATIGDNRIQRGSNETEVSVGDAILETNVILTSDEGRVRIECANAAIFVIGPATEFRVEGLSQVSGADHYLIRLAKGIAGFIAPLVGEGRFEVRTPSAVASVRSTEWTVDVDASQSAIFVREGVVAVKASSIDANEVLLSAGEGVDVLNNGQKSPIRIWGQARVDAMNARLGFDWQ